MRIYKILAAILHLGNVDFEGSSMEEELKVSINTKNHFEYASQLLNVEPKLLERSLLMREIEVDGFDTIT